MYQLRLDDVEIALKVRRNVYGLHIGRNVSRRNKDTILRLANVRGDFRRGGG